MEDVMVDVILYVRDKMVSLIRLKKIIEWFYADFVQMYSYFII